jgi:hypothetical protein
VDRDYQGDHALIKRPGDPSAARAAWHGEIIATARGDLIRFTE